MLKEKQDFHGIINTSASDWYFYLRMKSTNQWRVIWCAQHTRIHSRFRFNYGYGWGTTRQNNYLS